MQQIV